MCPLCSSLSFRATAWVSATKQKRRGFECLNCGARLRREEVLKSDAALSTRATLPAPVGASDTWRPPSARKPPVGSGTFEAVPSSKRPIKKQA